LNNLYTLSARGKFLGIEVRINDIPLAIFNAGGNLPDARINHYVIPGKNVATLHASNASDRAAVHRDSLTLLSIERGGVQITQSNWTANPQAPALPPEMSLEFDAGAGVGDWSWLTAPVITEPVPNVQALHNLLSQLHNAMQFIDIDAVMDLLALKNMEMIQAFGIDSARMLAAQRAFFAGLFAAANWAMAPLNLTNVGFERCANGRMVRPVSSTGENPISSTPGASGEVFVLPVLASHFSDGWKIVR